MRKRLFYDRGFAGYNLMVAIVAICGFAACGVDLGRVQLVKADLARAADAAARAAAGSIDGGIAAATQQAQKHAFLNKADGQPVELNPASDIEFGTWDAAECSFTKLPGTQLSSANAVRVIARRSAERGTAVQLVFGRIIGRGACDVLAESVVTTTGETRR